MKSSLGKPDTRGRDDRSSWKLYLAFPNKIVIPSVPGFPASPLSLATTYVVLPKENHMQSTEAATLDRKSREAEGSAVHSSTNHSSLKASPSPLSSRAYPDFLLHRSRWRPRVWFSPKENHIQSTEAATLDRKSGEAEGSAVRPSAFPNSGVLKQTFSGRPLPRQNNRGFSR
jgi:hypothetical protein